MSTVVLRSVGGLVFDTTFKETHQAKLEVTDNPCETGVVISDHAFMKPLELTLLVGVSDTPLSVPASGDPWAGASRSRSAFEALRELQASAEPVTIVTGLKTYENMVCVEAPAEQDKDTAGSLISAAQFREVILVTTQTVTYPPRAGAAKRTASAPKQKGTQQAKPVTDPTKHASLLSKLSTIFGGGATTEAKP